MDYLQEKWKLWYVSLDVNHDGTISMADVEESRSKFAELSKLDTQKGTEVKQDFADWWNKYIFRGRSGDVSLDDFVSGLTKDCNSDKAKFNAEMAKCFDTFFDVIDTNKDRSISEEEFLIAFKAYGHENVAKSSNFFKAYNPENGLVPLRKIVDSWIQFVTSDDKSKPDVVKASLEAGE